MTADQTSIHTLLIDNDAGDRARICEQLGKAISVSFEVTETALLKGFAGLKGRNDSPYDVILLGLDQPGCTGLDALKKLLPQAGDVPVIVLSGHEPRELGLDAVRCGALLGVLPALIAIEVEDDVRVNFESLSDRD